MANSREKWNVAGNADLSKILDAHHSLMEEFLQFCNNKKEKSYHFPINLEAESSTGNSFKEKVALYFGEYLPSAVIDDLCKLVAENRYGKCHFCMMPTESLVLSVLQILLDASNKISDAQGCNCPLKSLSVNANIANNSTRNNFSVLRGSNAQRICTARKPSNSAEDRFQHIGEDTILSLDCHGEFAEALFHGNQDNQNLGDKATAIVETPRVMNARTVSTQEPAAPLKERLRQDATMDLFHPVGTEVFQMGGIDPGRKDRTTPAIPNAPLPQTVCRFPISAEELRYYKIICGLAHSQWRMYPGVQLVGTTVTYQSVGESFEPHGHVDNFLVAGVCRKHFEDHHPSQSKKHYFYPRIGGCLLSLSSLSDFEVVQKSFLGANSANKLHQSHKLCFPIYHQKHWFVFIVDLRNKLFVFLDSYYDQNTQYQIQVRDMIVPSFKKCWYRHAEVKLDLEQFQILYPAVPKQTNPNDCGIFTLMFMEMWDVNIDLRRVFDFSDIANIRVKLANSFFFSSTNSVDKSLVNGFYEQGLDPQLIK